MTTDYTPRLPVSSDPPDSLTARGDAAATLAEALAIAASERGRAARDRHREFLARAIAEAEGELADAAGAARARVLVVAARAQAARAEDALHGANQLSLSAQRAASIEDCDDGWRRVAELAEVAAEAARRAAHAAELAPERASARTAARRAAEAADAARAIASLRNDAYVFHTAPGFSFGEGWHVAAAALLGDVTIQIEPGEPGAARAARFLAAAGLARALRPYRPRPRATKQVTAVVARAFAADPDSARARLRAAFSGAEGPTDDVRRFVDARVPRAPVPKVLLWVRRGTHHPGRNSDDAEIAALAARIRDAGATPILVGDAPPAVLPEGAIDLTLFWKEPPFSGDDGRRAQLHAFDHLRDAHGVVGQLGVTTAGMDGPALLGMPTVYLTSAPNPRMRAWVGVVPGYVEVVRGEAWLARVDAELAGWIGTR